MKTAYIYPGQGSQYIGMAYNLYQKYKECRNIINCASDILSYDLKKLLFEKNELINQTEYTQVAILVASRCFEKTAELEGYNSPSITAGLSLGEYNALITAGAFGFEDALKLVRKRGKLMQNAVPAGEGSMAAIIKVPEERIEEVCAYVSNTEELSVQISNYNCPGQYVIAGNQIAVDKVCGILKNEARLISKLNISIPSHCKLMYPLSKCFSLEINKIPIKELNIPYVSNVTAGIITNQSQIPDLLVQQLYSPVLWYQSINTLIDWGVEEFIEVGPGKVLTTYISRINKNVLSFSIDEILK